MLGKIKGKRRRGQQRTRWLDSIIDSMDMNLSKLQKIVKDGESGTVQSSSPWGLRKSNSRGLMGFQGVSGVLATEKQQRTRARLPRFVAWLISKLSDAGQAI